jgi:hypothetical protein
MRNKACKTHCKTFLRTRHNPLCRRHFSNSLLMPMQHQQRGLRRYSFGHDGFLSQISDPVRIQGKQVARPRASAMFDYLGG